MSPLFHGAGYSEHPKLEPHRGQQLVLEALRGGIGGLIPPPGMSSQCW